MDRWIPIDYQYGKIVLDFSQIVKPQPPMLDVFQWHALSAAETGLYSNQPGANVYTDVVPREESFLAHTVWEYVESSMSCSDELSSIPQGTDIYNARIARRVARAIALMAFGEEFLLR